MGAASENSLSRLWRPGDEHQQGGDLIGGSESAYRSIAASTIVERLETITQICVMVRYSAILVPVYRIMNLVMLHFVLAMAGNAVLL
jgi:hypothetical protein